MFYICRKLLLRNCYNLIVITKPRLLLLIACITHSCLQRAVKLARTVLFTTGRLFVTQKYTYSNQVKFAEKLSTYVPLT